MSHIGDFLKSIFFSLGMLVFTKWSENKDLKTPLKKPQYGHCVKSIFVYSRKACFLLGWSSNIISRLICPKSNWDEIFLIFDQNFWPFEKMPVCPMCKIDIFLSRKACFLSRWSANISSRPILSKNKQREKFQFLTKIMVWSL